MLQGSTSFANAACAAMFFSMNLLLAAESGNLRWPGRQKMPDLVGQGEACGTLRQKGNRAMRRLLNQLAHAAVCKRDCHLQIVFKRLSARLGYAKAVWARNNTIHEPRLMPRTIAYVHISIDIWQH